MLVGFRIRGVPTDHRVLSEMPDIARFGKGRLLQLRLHIEVILFCLVLRPQELLQIHRLKTGKGQVEILRFQFTEQIGQLFGIPLTDNLIHGDVQRLLVVNIQIDKNTLSLFSA